MRIITNFKDYYDHVAFRYGGGDPKIVYVRPFHLNHKKCSEINLDDCKKYKSVKNLCDLFNRYYDWRNCIQTDFRGIVIGDIFFAQIKEEKSETYRLLKEEDLKNSDNNYKHWWWNKQYKINDFINFTDPSLIDLCKELEFPVFSFNAYRYGIIINSDYPKLGESGIASYI